MWCVEERRVELALCLLGAGVSAGCALALGTRLPAALLGFLLVQVTLAYLLGVYAPAHRAWAPAPWRWLVPAAVATALAGALFGLESAAILASAGVAYQLAGTLVARLLAAVRRGVVLIGAGPLLGPLHASIASRRDFECVAEVAGVGELPDALTAARRGRLRGRPAVVLVAPDAGAPEGLGALPRGRIGRAEILDGMTFLEKLDGRVPLEGLSEGWFECARGFALLRRPALAALKRLVDLVGSLLLLVVTTPLLLLCALATRLSSPGPAFFFQERTGRSGRPFRIWKLRTMVPHDPREHSPYAAEEDPRLTAVGAVLRRLHLDELPQLLNILAGEMSLVGPRAEWTELAAGYRKRIPHYDARHAVRPGITGWAQVFYPYGRSVEDAEEKLRYDLYYLKHYSVFLDVVIVARTLKTVLGMEPSRGGRPAGDGSGASSDRASRPSSPSSPGT